MGISEVAAEIQLYSRFLYKRMPASEGGIRARLNLLNAYAKNGAKEYTSLLGELQLTAYDILEEKSLKELHQTAAHLLDLRVQLIFAHLGESLHRHFSTFTKELGFVKLQYPALGSTITGFLHAVRTVQIALEKVNEEMVVSLFLYLSEQIRVILDAIPENLPVRRVLIATWNEMMRQTVTDLNLITIPGKKKKMVLVSNKKVLMLQAL